MTPDRLLFLLAGTVVGVVCARWTADGRLSVPARWVLGAAVVVLIAVPIASFVH